MHNPGKISRLFGRIKARRFDCVWYALWIRLRRLDLGDMPVDKLGLSAERSKGHASSGGPDLARVLRTIRISCRDRAIDLGSGKGGAVFTFAGFPFEEVAGIEISDELVRISEGNAARLRLKKTHFLCGDAGKFSDLDRFTHIYMFNSFPLNVSREVMENLGASLFRNPRALLLIVKGPDSLEDIIDSKLFKKQAEFRFPFTQPFYLYSHEINTAGSGKYLCSPPPVMTMRTLL